MAYILRHFFIILSLSMCISHAEELHVKDVTKSARLTGEGVVAGYGDFDSDRSTDVFLISKQWTVLNVMMWDATKQVFKKPKKLMEVDPGITIVSISLADFDGDGYMDVLSSCRESGKTDSVAVEIHYGNMQSLKKGNFTLQMIDQPTILDVDGDLLPDLFGTNKETNLRSYWISSERTFRLEPQTGVVSTLAKPNSNAFIDVTGDMHPDLFVKSFNENNEIMFETWEQTGTNMSLTEKGVVMLNISDLTQVKHVGQMSFTDIDGDGVTDLILPVCTSDDCSQSVIYSRSLAENIWIKLLSNDGMRWQFSVDDMKDNVAFPLTIRFGDVTMDGNMDAVAILQERGGTNKFSALLENVQCDRRFNCEGARTFNIKQLKVVNKQAEEEGIENPLVISLMDVNENGASDFIVTCKKDKGDTYYTKVLQNYFNFDTAFLKVAVLSGSKLITPRYGSNQVGAIIQIHTTNTDGSALNVELTQFSQSSYFALQLPYVIFGLGKSPNFVDEIEVGIPKGPQKIDRRRSWTAVIPNAQVIVIPFPKDKPYDWVTKLLVTPGKLLLQTGGVLVGTLLLIVGIILILHIKEKKEDEREKRRDAHKFHFDAL